MALNTDLVSRVRSNINEPSTVSTPLRTDAEILQWLQDAQLDYVHRVPKEHFPELITSVTFSGSQVSIPADYQFFFSCTVSHTLSGTYTEVEDCFVILPGDSYLVNHYPTVLGAWAQVTGSALKCGPNVFSGTFSYIKRPASVSTGSVTFSLGEEHEAAVVAYASAQALYKTNDADADTWVANYGALVEAKGGEKPESKEIERA